MSKQAERIGVYGGMFNPPHLGHVVVAQEARQKLDLDRVLVVPTGDPPHRDLEMDNLPTREQRLQMAELAVRGQPGLEVSAIELDGDGTSFTVETLETLASENPDAELVLIIGSDAAVAFGEWRKPEQIGRLAQIAVATRAGVDWAEAAEAVRKATGGDLPLGFEMPRVDLSSTLIREHVRLGQSISHLVPAGVAELIEQQGLYR